MLIVTLGGGVAQDVDATLLGGEGLLPEELSDSETASTAEWVFIWKRDKEEMWVQTFNNVLPKKYN